MIGQMSIWDLMPQSLESLSEEEMARRVGDGLGITFQKDSFFGDYRARFSQITLSVEYRNYSDNGKLFIGCGYENKKDHSGAGAPRDTVQEAVEWFRRRIR